MMVWLIALTAIVHKYTTEPFGVVGVILAYYYKHGTSIVQSQSYKHYVAAFIGSVYFFIKNMDYHQPYT